MLRSSAHPLLRGPAALCATVSEAAQTISHLAATPSSTARRVQSSQRSGSALPHMRRPPETRARRCQSVARSHRSCESDSSAELRQTAKAQRVDDDRHSVEANPPATTRRACLSATDRRRAVRQRARVADSSRSASPPLCHSCAAVRPSALALACTSLVRFLAPLSFCCILPQPSCE